MNTQWNATPLAVSFDDLSKMGSIPSWSNQPVFVFFPAGQPPDNYDIRFLAEVKAKNDSCRWFVINNAGRLSQEVCFQINRNGLQVWETEKDGFGFNSESWSAHLETELKEHKWFEGDTPPKLPASTVPLEPAQSLKTELLTTTLKSINGER